MYEDRQECCILKDLEVEVECLSVEISVSSSLVSLLLLLLSCLLSLLFCPFHSLHRSVWFHLCDWILQRWVLLQPNLSSSASLTSSVALIPDSKHEQTFFAFFANQTFLVGACIICGCCCF